MEVASCLSGRDATSRPTTPSYSSPSSSFISLSSRWSIIKCALVAGPLKEKLLELMWAWWGGRTRRQPELTNVMIQKKPVTDSQTHAEYKTEKIHCITRAQALSPPSLNVCIYSAWLELILIPLKCYHIQPTSLETHSKVKSLSWTHIWLLGCTRYCVILPCLKKGPSWDIHAQMYQVLLGQSVQQFPVGQGRTLTVRCHFLFSVRTQAH